MAFFFRTYSSPIAAMVLMSSRIWFTPTDAPNTQGIVAAGPEAVVAGCSQFRTRQNPAGQWQGKAPPLDRF